jgi:sugar phosphate isomerase/epimerase
MMVAHMELRTRRDFLQRSAASALYASTLMLTRGALASPLGLPLGLQLYSVREQLPKDYSGVLHTIASLGYREVEAAGFFDHSPQQVKEAMSSAGLHCVSGHYPWPKLSADLDSILDFHNKIGAEYVICGFPGHKTPVEPKQARIFNLDDWRWNAEQFNKVGARVKAAGLKFGYHNHTMEFAPQPGSSKKAIPFDELLRLTDPALVTFEMDCGWVTVGGGDPVAYLRKYPERISMLHVKDFKQKATPGEPDARPPAAELGRGVSDYRAIFKAAKPGRIKHYFVEQESFDLPWQEALKIDADYMKNLNV